MSNEFHTDVRDELASRSTKTSVNELRDRGMKTVRVIRSSQILSLIESAVDRALVEHGLIPTDGDRAAVVASSQGFLRQMANGEQPMGGIDPEQQRRLLEAEAEAEALKHQLAEREAELSQAEARSAELDAELRVLHQRAEAAAPDTLLEELKALRSDIQGVATQPAGGPAGEGELNDKIADLGKELGKELARIGRKVGIAPAEEAPADMSALFNEVPELESNLDTVAPKETKGTDVEEALKRMKSLKGGN